MLLFLSRLRERKGDDLLIRAMSEMDLSNVKLCIAGADFGYKKTAEKLESENGIEKSVYFVGLLCDQEKFKAYRAADIYIYRSKCGDGLPTILIEACYAGPPMIVSNRVEAASLNDGEIGLSVEPTIRGLRDAIVSLLQDPDRLERYIDRAMSFMNEHIQLDPVLDKFEYCYKSAHHRYRSPDLWSAIYCGSG